VAGGVGTDIVAVDRIAALMRDRGMAFLERWFTAREIDYCSGKAVPSRHFAARFAAKEAVAKALPVAWDGPLPWRLIEIVNNPRGAPSVSLSGALGDAAAKAGIGEIKVSLSHCDEYALAFALVADAGAADDTAESRPRAGGVPVNRDLSEQVLRDYAALRRSDSDAELEAVRTAVLIEDLFGVTLSDAEIDPAVLADPSAVAALVARLAGAV
jgi:holo-[acyl-carrier protein] synthase